MVRPASGRASARWRTTVVSLCAGVVVAMATGCAEIPEEETTSYEPASIEELAGTDVMQVTFTDEAARRVSLQLRPTLAQGKHRQVPYASLIYDGQGKPWVYVATLPLTFHRVAVVVDRIEGDDVLLSRGPRPGTRVVTIGATEVYGAELGIAGGH